MSVAAWSGSTIRLSAFVEAIFDHVVAVFDAAGVPLPDRRLITIGTPVHDCEEVVISYESLALGGPGTQNEAQNCEAVRTVTVNVHVVRCFPTPSGKGLKPPTSEALTANAHQVMIDSWLLMDAVREIGNDLTLRMYDMVATVTPGEPQGGYLGVVLNIQAGVP